MLGIVGGLIGAVAGYIIGKNFSKLNFGCILLCNPKISAIYFAFIGYILGAGI